MLVLFSLVYLFLVLLGSTRALSHPSMVFGPVQLRVRGLRGRDEDCSKQRPSSPSLPGWPFHVRPRWSSFQVGFWERLCGPSHCWSWGRNDSGSFLDVDCFILFILSLVILIVVFVKYLIDAYILFLRSIWTVPIGLPSMRIVLLLWRLEFRSSEKISPAPMVGSIMSWPGLPRKETLS